MLKIAIYSRKSKFTGKGESIGNQIEMCQDYIKTHYPEEQHIISVFEDEGFSGKNFNRPQFQQMIAIEKSNPFDLIIVYRLDRISRNVGDFSSLIDQLNSYHTAFVCIKEQFDTATPMGRAMMNIAAVFAQLERETIAERIRDNMYMLAKTGRWLGGITPLGYTSEKVTGTDENGAKRSYFKLVQNEEEVKTISIIFNKYLELRSMSKLVTYLINNNIKTRTDSNFAVSTIKKILTNPVYCQADLEGYKYFCNSGANVCCVAEDCTGEYGFVGYCKTQTGYSGVDRFQNEIDKWIISVGRHKGVISGKDFVEVQNILLYNADSKIKFKQSHNPTALLSGLLVCKCGSYMRPKYYRENKKNNIRPYAYMCELKELSKKEKCDCNNLNGLYADKIICETLLNYEAEDNVFNKYLSSIEVKSNNSAMEMIKLQEKNKAVKQKELQNLINTIARGVDDVTLNYINSTIVSINKDIEAIDRELEILNIRIKLADKTYNTIEDAKTALKYFKDNLNTLSVENKRNFLRKCIDKIIWDGSDLHIFTKD